MTKLLRGPGAGEMSAETLESFVRQYIEAAEGGPAIFLWQGGEPTLHSVAFFPALYRCRKMRRRRPARPNRLANLRRCGAGFGVGPSGRTEIRPLI